MVDFDDLDSYADYRIESGFDYPQTTIELSREEQQRLHGCCDIAPSVYADQADPNLLGRLPVVVVSNTIACLRVGWGQVHLTHQLIQRRPISLGEKLRLRGQIIALEPHPRGEIMTSRWRYIADDDSVPLEVIPAALMLAPDSGSQPRSAGTGPKLQPEKLDYQRLASKRCTPQATVAYCAGTNNPIHSEPSVAQKFGFRAPIIAGTQTLNFLLEPLYQPGPVTALDLRMSFKRPVFWDDVIHIEAAQQHGRYRHLRALNGEQQCVADCWVDACVHATP